MKYIFAILMAVALTAPAATTNAVVESKPVGLEFSVEPYGMVSWTGLNGKAELGAGLALAAPVTRNLSIVGFGESDDTTGVFVDRFGAGLRYTAYLGKQVSLDGGIALAYDQPTDNSFLRLPFGANFTFLRSKNADLSLRAQYCFDIDGNGKQGTATGRAFVGPVFGLKF